MGFEGHRLNDMIDLVEQAKPEDMESAGKALQGARNAIAAAAGELGQHIDRVDWEGEAGEAFRKWGKNLVKDTHKLSDFAAAASSHMELAGAGLASVRGSMPPRDTRVDPKSMEDIPVPKRVEGNEEYDAAVKTEKRRQEAINQMNRLASFYLVSREGMASQEPPTFSAMPAVGVPEPVPGEDPVSPGEGAGGLSAATSAHNAQASTPDRHANLAAPGGSGSPDGLSSHGSSTPRLDGRGPIVTPDRAVGTEIDSVQSLPPQTTAPVPGPPSPNHGPTPHDAPPVLPFGGGRSTPRLGDFTARAPGPAATSKQVPSTQGRTGPPGPGRTYDSTGRGPAVPNGRPAPISPTAQGRSVANPMSSGQPPMGRSITGGTPRRLGEPGPRPGIPNATGAKPAQGVVGGRPSSGPVPGAGGTRMPKAPVVGTEASGGSRTTSGSVGQRGLAGTGLQGNGAKGQASRQIGNTQGGVVGTPKPRERTSGTRRSGFTPGGAGLVRNASGDQRHSAQEDEQVTPRSAEAIEGEETDLSRRRQVPPVND